MTWIGGGRLPGLEIEFKNCYFSWTFLGNVLYMDCLSLQASARRGDGCGGWDEDEEKCRTLLQSGFSFSSYTTLNFAHKIKIKN